MAPRSAATVLGGMTTSASDSPIGRCPMRPAARPIGCTWASNDPKTVADRFLTAWTTGDFGTARSLLHDDVSFSGPIDRFDNADAYLGALKGLSQIVKGAAETSPVKPRSSG